MKILHISTFDRQGGAAIAAYRLNEALNQYGVNSKMLVFDRLTLNPTVDDVFTYKGKILKLFLKKILFPLRSLVKKNILHHFGAFSIGKYLSCRIYNLPPVLEADIIYIHWINGGFINVKEIERILRLGKPTFIFLHDMWLLTGGCHSSFSCLGYCSSCEKCPIINKKSVQWISRFVLNSKHRLKKYKNLHLISPSNWMNYCIKRSKLFHTVDRIIIPNLINNVRFSCIDKIEARRLMELPISKRLVLFAADSGTQNPYKGWKFLKQALLKMPVQNIALVVIGNHLSFDEACSLPFPIYSMGRISDECTLSLLYNSVDVFVSPSLAESFGQTIIEAQACGTIPVAFDIGGIPDIIEHKKTGYLAKSKDIDDLKNGILWALDNFENKYIKNSMVDSVNQKFSYKAVVKLHITAWNNMLGYKCL